MKIYLTLLLALLAVGGVVNGQHNPNFAPGRNALVHLFEWRWNDIAEECERFLGPYGYGGVQVSPVNENALIMEPFRPWWERYQPISYRLTTRSGTEQEFMSMVRRCNNVGVRIYVDVVLNHMSHKDNAGVGTAGSRYSGPNLEFPEFSRADFHDSSSCPSPSGEIEDWNNPIQVRNCRMGGLTDLDQSKDYVKNTMIEFLNKLVDAGVAGFRVDAAKAIWPDDLNAIFSALHDLPTDHGFPARSRAFVFQEVIQLLPEPVDQSEYYHIGRVTEFKYGKYIGEVFAGKNQLRYLVNFGEGWDMVPDVNALIFIDNHDNQRGHGNGAEDILTFRKSRHYKMATAFMLASNYGVPRLMSSYNWDENCEGGNDHNSWVGPPSNANGDTLPVIINPDNTCGNGWICEHRWRQMYNMNRFRNVVAGTTVTNWWDNENNQIAFCRGNKGFIAINNDNYPLNASLQTCLPSGRYCDVFTADIVNGSCTGRVITVGSDGRANIEISNQSEDPVIAIHIESRV